MQTKRKCTSSVLEARLKDKIKELAEATDQAHLAEEMQTYLDFCSRFHQYSMRNIWLILLRKPDASMVAGYRKWLSLGRYVRKGEEGIPILAPVYKKEIDEKGKEEQRLAGFRTVYVFDISQTEGEPIPETPEWTSTYQDQGISEQLVLLAESLCIQIEIVDLPGEAQGVSSGGKIRLDPAAGTSTLIHELAHELMHYGKDSPRKKQIVELEAEAVAYVVGNYLGLEELSSPNYIALFGVKAEMIMAHLERIQKTSAKIINTLETLEGKGEQDD